MRVGFQKNSKLVFAAHKKWQWQWICEEWRALKHLPRAQRLKQLSKFLYSFNECLRISDIMDGPDCEEKRHYVSLYETSRKSGNK